MAGGSRSYFLLLLASVCSAALAQQCEIGSLPVACFPTAEANFVAGLSPVASNTCGLDGPERVCYQVGAGGMVAGTCDFCDASVPELAHPPAHMTDPHSPDASNATFWQSQNYSVVQYPSSVVITFPFNKTYDIRRISITFQSSRPESYAIYKSVDHGASFTPFHYFSLSCEATYGVDEGTAVEVGNEAVALCTSLEARLTPLSGGEAVFLPLEHRPSAAQFSSNQQLQEWVRATHLQLRLNRLNTFGDEILTSDPDVLDSYYYAISNVEVAGQCFCNGHASQCSEDDAGVLVCDCEHGTAGPDCGECQAFFQDRPWAPALPSRPTACAPCNCNSHSTECHLDPQLYAASGMVSGGVCDECQHNTEGVNCERCQVGFYPNPNASFTSPDACLPCDCDPRGTEGGESSCISSALPGSPTTGQCDCKANVVGRQCSQCRDGYYGLDINKPNGCSSCNCVSAGTVNASQVCEKAGGQCDCKLGVGGRDCGQCLPGYYDLSPLREEGCLECDCFIGGSVSQTCDGTTGDCFCRNNVGGSVPNSEGREIVGCTTPLPGHFCHGLALVYEAEGEEVASPSVVQGAPSDLFTGSGFVRLLVSQLEAIEGVAVPFSGEYDMHIRHGPPQTAAQRVSVRLRAVTDPQSNSTPPCSPPAVDREEMVELSSTASSSPVFTVCLLAGAEYTISLTALDAEVLVDSVIATPTLEQGAAGQLEVFQNQSGLEAYLTSGCHLDHIMVGGASMLPDEAFCERLTCSATFQLFNGAVACGCDPVGSLSQSCDPYRGSCSCRPGFSGRRCDLCIPGRGGSQCEACDCDIVGSLTPTCDRGGQCVCKAGVAGLTCNTCAPGYYNLSDSGCEECGCNLVGSEGVECNSLGQCVCREGVTGDKCDGCAEGYSSLTASGCSQCGCDLVGSLPPHCDPLTGQCLCRSNVLRPRCDRCNCSGNSDLCDLSTGTCLNCQRNTTGNSCEQCLPGYYGNPMETGCHPCPCPGTEPGSQFAATCEEVGGGELRCVGCREGHTGNNCEGCAVGYVGDPTGEETGSPLPCIPCDCNGNIDLLASETCHPATGVCLNCLDNTAGDHCERCARGYHGDAITAKNCTICPEGYYWLPDATCAPCGCHPNGSVGVECEDVTGRCECLLSVKGLKCDVCGDGFHRISEGCVACPACYDQVALEFNRTLLLYSDLLSRINSSMVSGGSLPADLLRDLLQYQALLGDLLERTINLTNRERELTEDVASAAVETAELEGLFGRYDSNVSRAEASLRGLLSRANSTSQLLQQLQAILADQEQIIRVELQSSLALASSQLETVRTAFSELVLLADMANETSFAQLQLALSLLSDVQAASSDAAEALRLLCEAISLQNETTAAITSLEETQLPPLEALFREAEEALLTAELEVPLATFRARRVLELILSISIPDYNTSSIQNRLQTLQDQKEVLVSDTNTTSMELDQLEGEVSSLSDETRPLITESRRLNLLAVELLARAHAALSFANRTVQEGDEFVAMVVDLLLELQRRLNDTQGFVEGLEEVIRNVELAEGLSLQAEEAAREKEGEVREAARLAEEAALVLEEASSIVQQALEAAVRVNEEARALLSDARLLNSSSSQLAEGVAESEERMTEVERVADEDRKVIASVTTTAQTVIAVARDLRSEIRSLLVVLDELNDELNRTELVPASRLEAVGSEVEQLESQANENQVIIDSLQDQVRLLEESAAVLRERHVSLQQHRDLLQSILNNVQRLDCRDQFQSIN